MLRCPVDVLTCLRTFVGYHQYLYIDTNFRLIKQTHAPCSQVCPNLKKYFHKEITLKEANGNPTEYKIGMESLRISMSAPAEDVIAKFSNAMELLYEHVTPVRSLELHFPYESQPTTFDPRRDHLEMKDDLFHTSIRIYFDDFNLSKNRIAITTIVHEMLQDYSINVHGIYRGKNIDAAEVMQMLKLH